MGRVEDAGIIGISRAFQIAGVPCVIASLWSIDDAASQEFMTLLVEHLREGGSSQALRATMLELKERMGHPYYWAPFVLFGAR